MSTTAALGGPPLAILYQHEAGPVVRQSVAAFALVSGVVSLIMLAAISEFRPNDALVACSLLPGLAAGVLLSYWTTSIFDHRTRAALLGTSAFALAILVARELGA